MEVEVAILRSQLVHAIQLDLLKVRIHEALVVLEPPASSSSSILLPDDNATDAIWPAECMAGGSTQCSMYVQACVEATTAEQVDPSARCKPYIKNQSVCMSLHLQDEANATACAWAES